jgi:hypothetical protein
VAGDGLANELYGAHSQGMELIISKIVGFLVSVGLAAMVALLLGYVAHYDFGVSRLDIRTLALIGAAALTPIVALLSAIAYFEKLRKSK